MKATDLAVAFSFSDQCHQCRS